MKRRSFARDRMAAALAALTLVCVAAPQLAHAQGAAAPIGNWQSTASATCLVVTPQGCALYANERVQVAGACSGNASGRGGILTITDPMPLEPGHVRYSIVWVNSNAITVFGEPFRRR